MQYVYELTIFIDYASDLAVTWIITGKLIFIAHHSVVCKRSTTFWIFFFSFCACLQMTFEAYNIKIVSLILGIVKH